MNKSMISRIAALVISLAFTACSYSSLSLRTSEADKLDKFSSLVQNNIDRAKIGLGDKNSTSFTSGMKKLRKQARLLAGKMKSVNDIIVNGESDGALILRQLSKYSVLGPTRCSNLATVHYNNRAIMIHIIKSHQSDNLSGFSLFKRRINNSLPSIKSKDDIILEISDLLLKNELTEAEVLLLAQMIKLRKKEVSNCVTTIKEQGSLLMNPFSVIAVKATRQLTRYNMELVRGAQFGKSQIGVFSKESNLTKEDK